jgi:hypothetical protein
MPPQEVREIGPAKLVAFTKMLTRSLNKKARDLRRQRKEATG